MNSSREPWNQVAIMRPSSCHTVRKRSHMPRIAQHRPVLDELADGEAVEQVVRSCESLSFVIAGLDPAIHRLNDIDALDGCAGQARDDEGDAWDGWTGASRS